jgi:hypothetical protein
MVCWRDRSRDWGHVNPRHPEFPRPSQMAPKQSNDGTAPEVVTRDPTLAWGHFPGKLFSHVFGSMLMLLVVVVFWHVW